MHTDTRRFEAGCDVPAMRKADSIRTGSGSGKQPIDVTVRAAQAGTPTWLVVSAQYSSITKSTQWKSTAVSACSFSEM